MNYYHCVTKQHKCVKCISAISNPELAEDWGGGTVSEPHKSYSVSLINTTQTLWVEKNQSTWEEGAQKRKPE